MYPKHLELRAASALCLLCSNAYASVLSISAGHLPLCILSMFIIGSLSIKAEKLLFQFPPHTHIKFSSSCWPPHWWDIKIWAERVLPANNGLILAKVENIFAAGVHFKIFKEISELGIYSCIILWIIRDNRQFVSTIDGFNNGIIYE